MIACPEPVTADMLAEEEKGRAALIRTLLVEAIQARRQLSSYHQPANQ